MLLRMLETLFAKAPQMVDHCDKFSADRGLDVGPQKKQLWDSGPSRPLIDTRLMWRVEKEEPDHDPKKPITRALIPHRADLIVHDERDRVSCVCLQTGEARPIAFRSLGADRGPCGALKYRCPAATFGFDCAGSAACLRVGGVAPGEYGSILRIDPDKHDRRISTPTP